MQYASIDWLNADVISVDEAPVPLWEGVIEELPGSVAVNNVADGQTEVRHFKRETVNTTAQGHPENSLYASPGCSATP